MVVAVVVPVLCFEDAVSRCIRVIVVFVSVAFSEVLVGVFVLLQFAAVVLFEDLLVGVFVLL